MGKKLFSWMLTICMLLTMMPTMAWAEGEVPPVEPTETPVVEQPEQQPAPADEEPVLMMSPAPVAEFDGTLDIANGSIVITASGYTQGDAAEETAYEGDYVIMQTDVATATANTITVNGIADGKTITLNGINIESSTKDSCPIKANATVTIQLLGENKIKYTAAQNSALHIAKDATVTLCVPAGKSDSDGSLTAEVTARYTSAIGAGDKAVAGSLVVDSGTITAKRTGNPGRNEGTSIGPVRKTMQGIIINGGIVNATSVNGNAMGVDGATGNNTSITITGGYVYSDTGFSSNLTVTGGNIKADAGKEPTIDGKTMTKLYVVDANGVAQKNEPVSVTVNSNTWKTYTDNDGIITTYLAESDTVADAQKLPDGWLIGGTCVCATAPLTFGDMVDTVDVYSAEKTVDVIVRGECKMPIHQNVTPTVKIDSVTLENGAKVEKSSVADYAVYDSDAKKLTLKPAGNTDNYTVKLYALRSIEDDLVYHEIKVWASNTVGRKLDVANGAITVEEASEAGKVTYKQGDNEFTVGAADNVIITGTSSENNIEVSTDATIVLKDLSLTDIKAKSPIKLTNNATLNLWLEGENTLTTGNYNHNEGEGGTVVSGVTTAAIFVESGSTLIIDSEVGTLKNDDIDTAHYGDKQTGYKGSLFAKIGASRGGASAIGGDLFASPDMACGNITIKGGNVTAQATMASNKHLSGSAIGSGYAAGDGSVVAIKQCGDVTISGGNVRALVADGANTPSRAISSGVGNLTITGGVIYASAPNDGWNGDSAGSLATFTGTLTIGETNGDDSDLYIYAATTTTNVTGTDSAAPAIGVSSGGTLNILSGTITAESTGNGPAIGVAAYAPVTDEPVVLNIAGGTIGLVLVDETQAGTAAAMGIGGNNYDNAVEINISGGTIESNDLNIGVRGNAESTVNISGDAVVKIGNGNIVGDVTVGEGATLSTNEEKEIKGDVTVKGGATINGTTLPEDVGSITVSGDKVNEVAVTDGTVTLPAGSTVTKEDGTSVELSAGGTLAADGAITAGGTVTTKDAQGNVVSTVVVPEGKDATVAADGTVTAPAGTKVTVGDKETTLTNGGTVSADGTVKKNYVGGGYYTPPVSADVDNSSLNNAAQAVGNAINNGSAEMKPTSGYTKEDIAKLQKEGKLNLAIEKKSGYASVADKNAIDAAIAKAGGAVTGTVVMYFDITPVLKTDDGKVVASVTDTEKPISITIDLSADLQKAAKDGKHIAVVRCHDGKVTFLDTKLNAAKTQVTFSSSDFSTYAVVAMEKQTSAQTFDAGIVVYAGMAVLAATGSAVVIGKKRRAE